MRLPLRPADHPISTPRRPWWSTTRNGQCLVMTERSNSISDAPLMFGMKLAFGRIAFTASSHWAITSVSTLRRQCVHACHAGIVGVGGQRQVEAGEVPEAAAAVLAIVDAVPLPAIGEDGVDVVFADDLLHDLGHELAVVGAVGVGHPDVREGPVAARLAVSLSSAPIRDGRRPRRHGWRADRRAPSRACSACARPRRARRKDPCRR